MLTRHIIVYPFIYIIYIIYTYYLYYNTTYIHKIEDVNFNSSRPTATRTLTSSG